MSIDFNARLQIKSGPFYSKGHGPSNFLETWDQVAASKKNTKKFYWIGKLAMLELQLCWFFLDRRLPMNKGDG